MSARLYPSSATGLLLGFAALRYRRRLKTTPPRSQWMFDSNSTSILFPHCYLLQDPSYRNGEH